MDEPLQLRPRLRRGGPRTPVPLLLVIAVAAGVGIAYVNQSAHATSATYRAAQLASQQQQMRVEDEQLHDDLARLESSERIVAAAQLYGMRPANRWAYVGPPVVVVPAPPQAQETGAHDGVVQRFLAALSGDFRPAAAP
jgi:hypothetical protein